ncbi:MAG: DUF3526 domain-containing protein [Bacteroidota bacterium]
MWQIIKNEWQYLSRTRLLQGMSLVFSLVLLLSIVLGSYQHQKQAEAHETAREHLRAQWESIDGMNPHSAAHYGTYVFKTPNLLSSLDEGVNSITGNVIRVEGHVQNEMVHSEASQMKTVSRFGKLKSSLILKYMVPLLLIFLGFSAVSIEKESDRLKLIILQGASSRQLILAKTVSVWLFGVLLLLLVAGAHSFMNLQVLNTDILQRTFLLLSMYALYYFIISGLTIFLTTRWQHASLALTTMLGIWMIWTVFLPNVLMSSVEKWHPLPSRNTFKTAMKEDRSKGIDGHNPSDKRAEELKRKILQEYGVDSISQLPINFDGITMQADEEYGNQVWDKHFGHLREVFGQQKRSLQFSGLINPFISLENASKGFAATDNLHHQDFLVQVESYRRKMIKMLNDEHAYGGSTSGDWGWEADNEFFLSVPDFSYSPPTIGSVVQDYWFDVFMLLFWSFLTFGLLFWGTQKIQVL